MRVRGMFQPFYVGESFASFSNQIEASISTTKKRLLVSAVHRPRNPLDRMAIGHGSLQTATGSNRSKLSIELCAWLVSLFTLTIFDSESIVDNFRALCTR